MRRKMRYILKYHFVNVVVDGFYTPDILLQEMMNLEVEWSAIIKWWDEFEEKGFNSAT
jgi:hypothetical protein